MRGHSRKPGQSLGILGAWIAVRIRDVQLEFFVWLWFAYQENKGFGGLEGI